MQSECIISVDLFKFKKMISLSFLPFIAAVCYLRLHCSVDSIKHTKCTKKYMGGEKIQKEKKAFVLLLNIKHYYCYFRRYMSMFRLSSAESKKKKATNKKSISPFFFEFDGFYIYLYVYFFIKETTQTQKNQLTMKHIKILLLIFLFTSTRKNYI